MTLPTPKPADPLDAKLRKLRAKATANQTKLDLKIGETISLPSIDDNAPHRGTVTAVESDRFRVRWPVTYDGTGRRVPPSRRWYSADLINNFIRRK